MEELFQGEGGGPEAVPGKEEAELGPENSE